MSTPPTGPTDPTGPDLARLFDDAVADVDPTDRLTAIHAATTRSRRVRRWSWTGGAVLATAGVVAVALVVGSGTTPGGQAVDPAAPIAPPPAGDPVTAFFVGPGGTGPDAPAEALYAYEVEATDTVAAVTTPPGDPDYRTLWPAGSLRLDSVAPASPVTVELTDAALVERPADLSAAEAALALQQVAWSMGVTRFELDGERLTRLLGIDLRGDLRPTPTIGTLSQMSITTPLEGATATGSLEVTGRSNGFEASVACRLVGGQGGDPGDHGPYVTTARGWLEDRLYPWRLEIDLSDLEPGGYQLSCTTDDPSGGAEGYGAFVDTRTITVSR